MYTHHNHFTPRKLRINVVRSPGNFHFCYPGVGGQVDFVRGASLCYDGLGKPILAFPSVTSKGETRIVPYIKQGFLCANVLNRVKLD